MSFEESCDINNNRPKLEDFDNVDCEYSFYEILEGNLWSNRKKHLDLFLDIMSSNNNNSSTNGWADTMECINKMINKNFELFMKNIGTALHYQRLIDDGDCVDIHAVKILWVTESNKVICLETMPLEIFKMLFTNG
jgi:hypothetical protein